MAAKKKSVVGLGEVLWDVLPERTCLGGALANFFRQLLLNMSSGEY